MRHAGKDRRPAEVWFLTGLPLSRRPAEAEIQTPASATRLELKRQLQQLKALDPGERAAIDRNGRQVNLTWEGWDITAAEGVALLEAWLGTSS